MDSASYWRSLAKSFEDLLTEFDALRLEDHFEDRLVAADVEQLGAHAAYVLSFAPAPEASRVGLSAARRAWSLALQLGDFELSDDFLGLAPDGSDGVPRLRSQSWMGVYAVPRRPDQPTSSALTQRYVARWTTAAIAASRALGNTGDIQSHLDLWRRQLLAPRHSGYHRHDHTDLTVCPREASLRRSRECVCRYPCGNRHLLLEDLAAASRDECEYQAAVAQRPLDADATRIGSDTAGGAMISTPDAYQDTGTTQDRAHQIREFQDRVLSECAFFVREADLRRVAGYKDPKTVKRWREGKKAAPRLASVLALSPAEFVRRAKRHRSKGD